MESTNYYILNIISSEDFRYSAIICEEELEVSSFRYSIPYTNFRYEIYYSCAGNIKKKIPLNTVIEFIKNKIPSDSIPNQPKLILTDSDIRYLISLILIRSNYYEDLTHIKYSIRQVK